MNNQSANFTAKGGHALAGILSVAMLAGINLTHAMPNREGLSAASVHAHNLLIDDYDGLFAVDALPIIGGANISTSVGNVEGFGLPHWDRVVAAIAAIGGDTRSAYPLYKNIVAYLDSRSISIADLVARVSTDREEGIAYAAIRILVNLPFEEAMDLDWDTTEYILESHKFPDRVTISIRSLT
ncbi:hypothetical protein [Paraburkholderia oxyphila]|uniref:hypothetical protein n=1 Tax=Paraburkholderia oxyphila TaxID=614212 RepID=UPI0012EECAEA|nr:hypothetical protein [Paraburkholderia oxyphila]